MTTSTDADIKHADSVSGSNTEKVFTIRYIPPDMHKRWKMACLILDVSMEDFARDAIREKLEETLQKLKAKSPA